MVQFQQTLNKSFSIEGKGLHTGAQVSVVFHPSAENSGIQFKRIDTDTPIIIDALVDYVTDTQRGTVITKAGVSISTIEHALAALIGYEIHNCFIEVSGPELPILDGSSRKYAEAIEQVGIQQQTEKVDYFVITERFEYTDVEKGISIIGLPDENYTVNSLISYPVPSLKSQFATFSVGDNFGKEIAPCRTFVFVSEIEPLLKSNLIKGGDLDNAIIFIDKKMNAQEINHLTDLFEMPHLEVKVEEGILNNIEPYFDNEPARHKLLDVLGDLALVGKPIKGRIIATKPGHTSNVAFAKLIRKAIKQAVGKYDITYDPNEEPVMDILQIRNTIPHRYPFLMVDKVISVEGDVIVGMKNITSNEPIFTGHFPDEPVFPGVLLIEAMAQSGGLLVLSQVEEPEKYSTYFMKIDGVKFRKKVVPGDTVFFRVTMISPMRRGCAEMKGEAIVGNTLVAECTFLAQIVKNK